MKSTEELDTLFTECVRKAKIIGKPRMEICNDELTKEIWALALVLLQHSLDDSKEKE